MTIVTKTGDGGKTSISGKKIDKTDDIITAIGDIDEANAAIGAFMDEMVQVQCFLFDLGSIVSGYAKTDVDTVLLEGMESSIVSIESSLPPQRYFIIPSGHIQFVRSVVRRCERSVLKVIDIERFPNTVKTLNRLSDYIYIIARQNDLHIVYTRTGKNGFHEPI